MHLLILIGSAICFTACWIYVSKVKERRRRVLIAKAIMHHHMEDLKRRQKTLNDMICLLNSHAGRHSRILHEAGYGRLGDIQGELARAVSCCESLIKEKHFRDARRLLRFLLKANGQKQPKLKAGVSVDFRLLSGWEKTANEKVISCVERLKEVAGVSCKLEIRRPNRRRRTMNTLSDLRRALTE